VVGLSLSGGHVLAVAATDPRLAAVVSQVPLIDGWHRGRTLRGRPDWEVIWRTAQFTFAAIHDILRSRLGWQPYFVPVVAIPVPRPFSPSPKRWRPSRRWDEIAETEAAFPKRHLMTISARAGT
jgi:hypothetical protein